MTEISRDVQKAIAINADIIVIGGGATGLGCAVDAATRGYKTILIEKDDFGRGTSSKSTKLVHGGVRYLEQGNVFLVQEALLERGRLLKNAPHLVHDLSFVIPNYSAILGPYYLAGLKAYDILAGRKSFGASRWMSRKAVMQALPNIKKSGLKNGVLYHDGQFDDTRLLVSLMRTFHKNNGMALNYVKAINFIKNKKDQIIGVLCRDKITKEHFELMGKVVINATGVYTERVQLMDDENIDINVSPSQGSHIVVDEKYLGKNTAIMIPKTPDGRVLFAIPWHGKTLIGTTDTFTKKITNNPKVNPEEIDFMLETAGRYMEEKPIRKDILSIFAGIRPLVSKGKILDTKSISRSHGISVSDSGLISITGGKWTTYRKMAEDTIDKAILSSELKFNKCQTKDLILDGGENIPENIPEHLKVYGSNLSDIIKIENENPVFKEKIHPDLPYTLSQVVYACKYEMALTVEDVLSRRLRATFLNAKAAIESAEKVAAVMKSVLKKSELWEKKEILGYKKVANSYVVK